MKIIISIIAFLAFSGISHADRPLRVKSKDYTCSDLRDLVRSEGTVHVRGFGSLDVHYSSNACRFGWGPYKTSWKTIDKRFCIAGYSCRKLNDSDR